MTGDVVQVLPNGSLQVIDRTKNLFKLSQGEYIAPEKIEQIYMLSNTIAQCFVYGNPFKDCTVAVVIPEEAWVMDWARNNVTAADVSGF